MRSSALSVFSFSLLVVIQLVISTRQLSIREIVVVRSSLSSQLKVVCSWVYRWKSISWHPIRSFSGAVYNRYSNGPNTELWGTPNLSGRTEEVNPSIWTDWERSVRLDWSHEGAFPFIPNLDRSLCNKFLWSTVSKAADRSSSKRTTHCLSSIDFSILHSKLPSFQYLHFSILHSKLPSG